MLELNKVYNMDCIEGMKLLPDNSIDSIVTDPPYEIGFMGKGWDSTGIANNVDMRKECLRVLKPGGHLLSFAATRTYHRMACAIEDAGFEVRDMIEWVYGSGFPKSLNISKAIDKKGGRPTLTYEVASALKEARESRGITKTQADIQFCGGTTLYSWYEGRPAGIQLPTSEYMKKIASEWTELEKYVGLTMAAEREIIGEYKTDMGGLGGERLGDSGGNITISKTENAKQWEGWGTALKPAHEPICMARKPLADGGFDVVKAICLYIIENDLYDKEIVWRIKNVKPVEKQKSSDYFLETPQQKMVEVSVGSVSSKEMQWLGKKIEILLESLQENTEMITEKNSMQEVEYHIEQTNKGFLPIGNNTNTKENLIPSMPIDENVSVVEKQAENFGPLTIQIDDEENIEKALSDEIYIPSGKNNDTPKNDIDCCVGTATSQWVCMDIVHTIKIEFQNKEYEFEQLSDGSFIRNNKLKPYIEPKKLNVAENALKWGTGGINIDKSRVETTEKETQDREKWNKYANKEYDNGGTGYGEIITKTGENSLLGRFPANLIHDNSEEVRECFPETGKIGSGKEYKKEYDSTNSWKNTSKEINVTSFADSGNASRFFKSIIYQAKASKSERNKGCEELEEKPKVFNGQSDKPSTEMKDVEKRFTTLPKANNHPTVKPTALMEYLIKMVTKEGGTVLDPFTGSGTTLVAAKRNLYNYIGFELSKEYCDIIEARLKSVQVGLF